jgi:hypothetical protein
VRSVGSRSLHSRTLVEYTLATPGVATAIVGIGHIDSQSQHCQIEQNLSAAQVPPESLSSGDRVEIERMALDAKDGQTNWFQLPLQPLSPPRDTSVIAAIRDGQAVAQLSWQTAYAAEHPIQHYEIARNGRRVAQVAHRPQTSRTPFTFVDPLADAAQALYTITSVDAAGRRAATGPLRLANG